MTFILCRIRYLGFGGAFFLCWFVLHAQPEHLPSPLSLNAASVDSMMQVGEELYYNVTYGGFNIGQLHFIISSKVVSNQGSYFVVHGFIDSYRGVPFVNVHTVYEDHITDRMYSKWFFSRTKKGNRWSMASYEFDYPARRLVIEHGIWKGASPLHHDTVGIDTFYQDGLSLLYVARALMVPGAHYHIPSYVSEKSGYTTIDILPQPEHESIDAIEYPVDLIHFKGEAGFIGVFGFQGEFEGWFSNDAAHVPVIAQLKVLIGSVRVELMKWKRPGWLPPKYSEGKEQ